MLLCCLAICVCTSKEYVSDHLHVLYYHLIHTRLQQQQGPPVKSSPSNLAEEISGDRTLGHRGGATTASGILGHPAAKTNCARHSRSVCFIFLFTCNPSAHSRLRSTSGNFAERASLTYHLGQNNYSFDALQAYCFGINIKL